MRRTQTAWAIQGPGKVTVTSLVPANRLDAINALRGHFIGNHPACAGRTAFRRGFWAVNLEVTGAKPTRTSDER